MKKAAQIWRLQAQKGRQNKLKNAGILLFGIVGDNKIAGNREDNIYGVNREENIYGVNREDYSLNRDINSDEIIIT